MLIFIGAVIGMLNNGFDGFIWGGFVGLVLDAILSAIAAAYLNVKRSKL